MHKHTRCRCSPPSREATEQYVVVLVLGLLGDVSMETVMSDLQACALPSIWLRLANQITSTHTQMNRRITSPKRGKFSCGFLDQCHPQRVRYQTLGYLDLASTQHTDLVLGLLLVFLCTKTGVL